MPLLARANSQRLLVASAIGALVSVVQVIFVLVVARDIAQPVWRSWYVGLHLLLIATCLGAQVVCWSWGARVPFVIYHLFYGLFLAAGVGLALADQLIAPILTPFMVASIVLPLVLYLQPPWSVVYHGVGWLVLAGGLFFVQPNPGYRLITQVNSLLGLAIGTTLSLVLWLFFKTNTLQSQRIEAQNRELVALNATKDKVFSVIAHDLRGPVAGMSGVLDLLLDEANPATAQEKDEGLRVLRDSAASVSHLLENLLLWSKAQRGLVTLAPVALEAGPLVDRAARALAGLARSRNVAVHRAVAPEARVLADPVALETVVRNLLSNAIKFTPAGGRVDVSVSVVAGGVLWECRDTGVGMTAEDLARVSHGDQTLGSGLGLVLCREFVAQSGGRLEAASVVGQGTRFWFTLPTP